MKKEWPYRFPRNMQAKRNAMRDQADKCMEEADEVRRAMDDGESQLRIAEESWDCIQACEGVLRKLPRKVVVTALAKTKIKCWRRGDYRGRP